MRQGAKSAGVAAIAVAIAVAVACLPSGCGDDRDGVRADPGGRKNVLLVTLDTTRRDRLGAYGCGLGLTPNLDALAAGGAAFEDARTQVPLTLPAHATIMTGLDVLDHGVRENGYMALDASATTLAEALSGEGYRTAAFVSSFVLDARFGLDQGFSTYDDDMGPPSRRPRRWLGHEFGRWERSADAVTDAAIGWIEENAGEGDPFFAWVHYYDPHMPWSPPALWQASTRHPYDGEVAFMDSQVGRLVRLLEEEGLSEDTLVVAASDHGESVGEHRTNGHGGDLFEPAMRIALIARLPGVIPEGARPGGLASLVDVAATIADLSGARASMPGASLAPAIRGEAEDGPPRMFYMETVLPAVRKARSEIVGVLWGRWKLVLRRRTGATDLYDLLLDPGETRTVAKSHPAVVQRLKSWVEGQAASWKGGSHMNEITIDPVIEERLRALGYVADAGEPAPGGPAKGP